MIVESLNEFRIVKEKVLNQKLLCIPIYSDNKKHYTINRLSLIFFYIFDLDDYFIVPINHSETLNEEFDLIEIFNNSSYTFVLNKKAFYNFYKSDNLIDLELFCSYNGIDHFELEDSIAHRVLYRYFYREKNINDIIPLSKHIESCCYFAHRARILNDLDINSNYLSYDKESCISLNYIETTGLYVDYELFQKKFQTNGIENNLAKTEYNTHTITGRPSNRFGGINYAALNKKDGSRAPFISRFEKGFLIQFDYDSYHLRLLGSLLSYPFPLDRSVHDYLGTYYFNTSNISKIQREESKSLTFKILYGYSNNTKGIPFFEKMMQLQENLWSNFYWKGKIKSPLYKREFKKDHFPNNITKNKLFNYYIQNFETERNIKIILLIQNLLEEKYLSKLILYTYDSFLFDFNPKDGMSFIKDVSKLLQIGGFPIKMEIGYNYDSMKEKDYLL